MNGWREFMEQPSPNLEIRPMLPLNEAPPNQVECRETENHAVLTRMMSRQHSKWTCKYSLSAIQDEKCLTMLRPKMNDGGKAV